MTDDRQPLVAVARVPPESKTREDVEVARSLCPSRLASRRRSVERHVPLRTPHWTSMSRLRSRMNLPSLYFWDGSYA